MRVVSGDLGGRKLVAPTGGPRPTSIGCGRRCSTPVLTRRHRGCRVLDAFAGSGALGIEALSPARCTPRSSRPDATHWRRRASRRCSSAPKVVSCPARWCISSALQSRNATTTWSCWTRCTASISGMNPGRGPGRRTWRPSPIARSSCPIRGRYPAEATGVPWSRSRRRARGRDTVTRVLYPGSFDPVQRPYRDHHDSVGTVRRGRRGYCATRRRVAARSASTNVRR